MVSINWQNKDVDGWCNRGAICFVILYKVFVSPLQHILHVCFGFQVGCRFTPTCSEYAVQCLRKFPFKQACKYIVKRLMRCHPFGQGGYDPVP